MSATVTARGVDSSLEDWMLEAVVASGVGVAQRDALGTSARVVVWPPESLSGALAAVEEVLRRLDHQASRFRDDSEISWVHRAGGGLFLLSEGLAEAISVALAAARWTDGRVDPTVGAALVALGYDRDFRAIVDRGLDLQAPAPVPGWQSVKLEGRLLHLPSGVQLDLGATAKGLGADRAAKAALKSPSRPGGVLVSLGGDIAVAGVPPRDGWPILVADDHRVVRSPDSQLVRLLGGALATSSVTCRRWRQGGRELHHVVDPANGLPISGPWRTASVAAPNCAEANAASTAALVAGDAAVGWLETMALPARLVAHDGVIRRCCGWPASEGGRIGRSAVRDGRVGSAGRGSVR